MKRSELYNKILSIILDTDYDRSGLTFSEAADNILDMIEKEGMLPPYRLRTKEEHNLFDAMDQYNYIHSWESENEEE